MVRTNFGDGKIISISTASGILKYKVKLSFGIAYLRPYAIVHVLPNPKPPHPRYVRHNGYMEEVERDEDPDDDESDDDDDDDDDDEDEPVLQAPGAPMLTPSFKDPVRSSKRPKPTPPAPMFDESVRLLFGTEKMYLFIRLYCLFVNILSEGRDNARTLEAAMNRKKKVHKQNNSVHARLGSASNAFSAKMQQQHFTSSSDSRKRVGPHTANGGVGNGITNGFRGTFNFLSTLKNIASSPSTSTKEIIAGIIDVALKINYFHVLSSL